MKKHKFKVGARKGAVAAMVILLSLVVPEFAKAEITGSSPEAAAIKARKKKAREDHPHYSYPDSRYPEHQNEIENVCVVLNEIGNDQIGLEREAIHTVGTGLINLTATQDLDTRMTMDWSAIEGHLEVLNGSIGKPYDFEACEKGNGSNGAYEAFGRALKVHMKK